MRIGFGLALDGQRTRQAANRLADLLVGPMGMLDLLEGLLGLQAAPVSGVQRIVQFRECLERACAAAPGFYDRSLAADSLGTAATLLGWRDLWHLHGWNGRFSPGVSNRLRDLGEVERHAAGTVAPSMGERLQAVVQAMRGRRLPIENVTLYDPLESFPLRWREILGELPVNLAADTQADSNTMLGELRRMLIEGESGGRPGELSWRQDGSFRIVRAESRLVAARWLAEEVKTEGALIVAQADATLLDRTFEAAGVPLLGLKEHSAVRPALQLLPLALQLLWKPVDIRAVVEFLSHPVCPIRGYARRKLAAKLADKPGLSGSAWQRVKDDIAATYTDQAPDVIAAIRNWIECDRYDPAEGVPVAVLSERVRRLAVFFHLRSDSANQASALSASGAHAQCLDVLDSLRHVAPSSSLRPPQVAKLLAQATARGSSNPLLRAQVGATLAIDEPGAAIEPADHVVWWQLAMPSMPELPPWSSTEIRQLAEAGVALPSMDDRLRWLARDWLKPVRAAGKKLTLILPPPGAEVHPLWLMIEALIPSPKIESIEDVALSNARLEPLPVRPLPALRRWWRLPAGSIPRRAKESHSSVAIFLDNPYHWVLRYPAALMLSRSLDIADGPRLYGLLAHRIVERFFKETDWLSLSDEEMSAWYERVFREVVDEEGAVLRLPGKQAELMRCHFNVARALVKLRQHLREACIVKVDTERRLGGHFTGGEIGGSADLVVTREDGCMGVIDMKWSGEDRYPMRLKNNTHLQLAIYGELIRQECNTWPELGYFILSTARLFTQTNNFFPGGVSVADESDIRNAMLWHAFNESWKWRDAQLREGLVEVVMPGTEHDDDSRPPETGMPIDRKLAQKNAEYNDYITLAGWEAER